MSDTERKEIITTIMAAIDDLENQWPRSEDEDLIDSAIEKLTILAVAIRDKAFKTLEVGPGY